MTNEKTPNRFSSQSLAAIDPILDPILTTVNVYGNCAATALIAKRKKGRNALSEN